MMKPLELNQRALTWLFMCSPPKRTLWWKKLLYFTFFCFVFVTNFLVLVAASTFALKSFSINLEEFLYAFFQISALAGIVYVMLAAFLLRHKISTIFEQLSDIYEASKSFGAMWNQNFASRHRQKTNFSIFFFFSNKTRCSRWFIPFLGSSQYQKWLFLRHLRQMHGDNLHQHRVDVRTLSRALLVFERQLRCEAIVSSISNDVSESLIYIFSMKILGF